MIGYVKINCHWIQTKPDICFSEKNNGDHNCYRQIKITDQVIPLCGEGADEKGIKFLGLELDDKLIWKYHIQSVKRQLASQKFICTN